MLIPKVKRTLDLEAMLTRGDRVLVAVSGGPDSVCLLHVLASLAVELGITLHVAHLDHRFRGQESARDAAFVRDLAGRLGITATIESIDVPAYCRERGLSAQEGAREVRYDFLQKTSRRTGATRIATGHTADDQAETLLMRLVRGAGTSGLAAIPPKRDTIIRPLISVTRRDILRYLEDHVLSYRTDPSNLKPLYTRNRIRAEVLPALARLNPRIVETLAATADLLRDEDRAVDDHLTKVLDTYASREGTTLFFPKGPFLALPPAFQRRLLRRIVNELLPDEGSSVLPLDQNDAVREFLRTAQTGRTLILPRGLSAAREYNAFLFQAATKPMRFSRPLTVPGTTVIPEIGLTFIASCTCARDASGSAAQPDAPYVWQAAFDQDRIAPLLTVRSRIPGDRFRPAGMGGKSRKLQDYFVDRKVPARMRDRIPLLVSGNDILWVIGHRTDIRSLPGPGTTRLVVVTVCREAMAPPHTVPQ